MVRIGGRVSLSSGGLGCPSALPGADSRLGALGERGKKEGSRGAADCREVPLRPQRSTARQGSPRPPTSPAQQQPEEPTLSQKQERPGVGARGHQAARLGWESASHASRPRSEGQGWGKQLRPPMCFQITGNRTQPAAPHRDTTTS